MTPAFRLRRVRAPSLFVLGLLAGGCGLRGSAPSAKPPAPFSGLSVQGREGAVRVSWNANPKAGANRVVGFDVLRRVESPGERTFFEGQGSVLANPGGGRSYVFVDDKLAAGKTYTYRVRPRLESEPPAAALRYTGPEESIAWIEPPAPPTNVRALPLHLATRLAWDAAPGATGYRIYSLDSAGRPSLEPVNRGTIERTSWTSVALLDGREYRYVVRSVILTGRAPAVEARATPGGDGSASAPAGVEVADAAAQGISIPAGADVGGALRKAASELAGEGVLPGIESRSSAAVAVTPGITEAPPAPHQLKLALVPEGVALSWRPSQGEEVVGYFIERRALDGGKVLEIWQRLNATPMVGSGWVDRDAKKGRTYEYQVRAVDASGTEGKPTDPKKATFTP